MCPPKETAQHPTAFIRGILDTLPLPFYLVDAKTLTVLCTNKNACATSPAQPNETTSCHQLLRNQDTPCKGCPVLLLRSQPDTLSHTEQIQNPQTGKWINCCASWLPFDTERKNCLVGNIPIPAPQDVDCETPHLDECTGVPDNAFYEEYGPQLLDETVRQGTGAAVLALKISGLHHINSIQGYDHGDAALKNMASAILSVLPHGALFARRRGNDFSILYPRRELNSSDEILSLLGRLEEAMDNFCQPEIRGWFKARFGVSLCPEHGLAFEALNRKARQAVVVADRSGCTFSYNYYDDALMSRLRDREELLLDLSLAIRREELELVFQPKHDIQTSHIVGAEALLRWNHPARGQVSAEVFIPLAEEALTIPAIDNWVMNEACRQWRRLIDLGYPMVPVSINISPQKFYQPDFIQILCSSLKAYNIPPSMMEIELTERTALQDIDKAISIMERIRAKGFQVAIDDFGTGYSSLNYLRSLPFDTVKLDRSFIADSGDNIHSILRAIVGLVKVYKAAVLFEGIETETQYQLAKEVGCDLIQGYYTGRPMRPDCLADILERQATLSGLNKMLRAESRVS